MMVENTARMSKLIIFIIMILTARYSFSLKVYRSLVPIESTEGIAGLHFLKQNNANASLVNSMTYCLRFNYKRMLDWTAIWTIGSPGQEIGDLIANMFISANYPNSWWGFGGEWWLIGNKFFYANQWQHLCIAYDKIDNSLTTIKVN